MDAQAWEYDEPPIKLFDSPEQFWQHIRDYEADDSFKRTGGEPPEFLVKLFAAAGQPLTA